VAKRKKKEEAPEDAASAAETVAAAPAAAAEAPTAAAEPADEKPSSKKRGKRKPKVDASNVSDESEAPTQSAPPVDAAADLDPSEAKTAGSSPVLASVVEANENGSDPETQSATEVADATDVALSPEELERTVEALLFAAEEPIAPREIARASGSDSATIRKVLTALKEKYESERRPWDVLEVAGGYRLMTRPEYFPAITRLKTQTAQRKLTQAALETLALIAYRQPIGRAEIETVRGVNAGPVLRQLLDKKLIRITGRGTGLGQPLLYGTTDYFLEHFGIKSTQELPKPGEFKNT